MKSILNLVLLFFFLLPSKSLFSQEEAYVESENIPDTYIGEFNEDYLFYSKKKTLLKNKEAKILKKDGDNFVEKFEYVCLEDERIIDVFTEKGSLYILSDIKDGKNLNFTIKELDVNFKTVFTKVLFSMNSLVKNKLSLTVKHEDNALGIICFKKTTTNEGYVSIINLANKQSENYTLNIQNLENYDISDIVFNSKLEAAVIVEDFESKFSGVVEADSKLFLAKCSNGVVKTMKINAFQDSVFCRTFKFCKLDESSYFLGSLIFKNERSELLEGYSVIKTSFDLSDIDNPKLIYNRELHSNAKYWMPKDFEQIQKNKYVINSSDQKLVKILKLNNEDFMFMSETQYTVNGSSGGGITYSPSITNTGSNTTGFSTLSRMNSFDNTKANMVEDIIFSKVNIEKSSIEYTNKTKNRYESLKDLFYSNKNTLNFSYTWDGINFKLYYNLTWRNFDTKGLFSPEYIGNFQEDFKRILVYTVDDEVDAHPISKNYNKLPLEKLLVDTNFKDEEGKNYVLLFESKKPMIQGEIKKYRIFEFK